MIKIAICDDEITAIQTLVSQINSFFQTREIKYSVAKFLDGEGLLNYLIEGKDDFDIIFLDIQMNKTTGMEVAKIIRKKKQENIFIIFVTALKEYVFDAFEVNASNYLVKPIERQKLYTTLEKIISAITLAENKYLFLHKAGEVKKIPLGKIMYCEVINHKVFVYEQKIIHEYSGKIEDLAQELSENFFRCHRSFIVNLKYVDSYKDGVAYMPSTEKVPIATRRQREFMQALLNYQRKEVR